MKNILKLSALAIFCILCKPSFSQVQDSTIVVNGVCQMCKRIIENASYIEGVKDSKWNVKTKELLVSFDTSMVSLMDINKAIVKSGYDTEFEAAQDKDYEELHPCCHYRDPQVVKEHEDEQ